MFPHGILKRSFSVSQPSFKPSPKLVALVEAMKQHTRQQEALRQPARSASAPFNPNQINVRHLASAFIPWVSQTSRNAYQQVQLQLEIPADVWVPHALALPLQTILTHLLQNALTHGIEPARERARHGKPPLSALKLAVAVEEDELILTLADDGRGLPELFQPEPLKAIQHPDMSFASRAGETSIFSLPSGSTGLGVGLHIVKSLAQKLSGDIRFRSLPHLGTTVIVSLPLPVVMRK